MKSQALKPLILLCEPMLIRRLLLLVTSCLIFHTAQSMEIDESANIGDTNTNILGVNHIGLSVTDLDAALNFYQQATGFELLNRRKVSNSESADKLYDLADAEYEIATLKAPNMVFELIEFKINESATRSKMLPQGPGMTHTCFQSPMADSGYRKFVEAGAQVLSRGNEPVDLGGYGVTYAYAYDPDGNMFEMEELDGEVLARAGYDDAWQDLGLDMWMSQVGLATSNLSALMEFYQSLLGIKPYRLTDVLTNPKVDDIANIDGLKLKGGWFRMNSSSKVLEIWEYVEPKTMAFQGQRNPTNLGYSFSLEVSDIDSEYQRMKKLGVEFFSEPVELDGKWQAYARDADGNIFSIRQYTDADSPLSVRALDQVAAGLK